MNLLDVDWWTLGSTLFGGSLASFFGQLYIKKSIEKLEKVADRLEDLLSRVIVLETKMENSDEIRRSHEKLLSEINASIRFKPNPS